MRRVLVTVICAALLVALVAANRLVPSDDDMVRPITAYGTIGRMVHTTAYDIKVDRVTAGRGLAEKGGFDKPEHTSGVFLLVWAELTAADRPVSLDTAYLRTADGHRYDTTDAIGFGALTDSDNQPGLTRYGVIAFELPPYRVAGARLVVGPSFEARLSAQADMDLGLSADAARRLVAQAPKVVTYSKAMYR